MTSCARTSIGGCHRVEPYPAIPGIASDEDFAAGPWRPNSAELASPTERERDVLELIAGRLSNREIGAQLFLAEGTVKTHVGSTPP